MPTQLDTSHVRTSNVTRLDYVSQTLARTVHKAHASTHQDSSCTQKMTWRDIKPNRLRNVYRRFRKIECYRVGGVALLYVEWWSSCVNLGNFFVIIHRLKLSSIWFSCPLFIFFSHVYLCNSSCLSADCWGFVPIIYKATCGTYHHRPLLLLTHMESNSLTFLFTLCLSLSLGTFFILVRRRKSTLHDLRGPESRSFWLGPVSIVWCLPVSPMICRSSTWIRISKGDRRIRIQMDARIWVRLARSRLHGC